MTIYQQIMLFIGVMVLMGVIIPWEYIIPACQRLLRKVPQEAAQVSRPDPLETKPARPQREPLRQAA